MSRQSAARSYPAVGRAFKLKTKEEGVRDYYFTEYLAKATRQSCYFIGKWLGARLNKRFKLVRVPGASSFAEVKQELRKQGRIPRALWCLPFMDRFDHDDLGPVGFAEAAWHDDDRRRLFVVLRKDRQPFLVYEDEEHVVRWSEYRWLVQVP